MLLRKAWTRVWKQDASALARKCGLSRLLTAAVFALGFLVHAGAYATALQFAGDDDRVDATLPALFNNLQQNSFTVTGRLRPDAAGFSRVFFAQSSSTNFVSLAVGSASNLFFYTVLNDRPFSVESTTQLVTGQWISFAARWDAASSTSSLYINGVVAATTNGGFSTVGSVDGKLTLGSRTGGAQYLNGALDDFVVWPTALSDSQIAAVSAGTCIGSAPVLGYNFEVGTPGANNAGLTNLPDFTANGFNGTLTGFALNGATSNWIASPYGVSACHAPSLALASSANPSTYGQSVTLSATLGNTSNPTGTVTICADATGAACAGATWSCNAAVNPATGVATCSTAAGLPAGTHAITASYGGDTNNYGAASTSALPQTVNKAPLTITADNKSRAYGTADPPFTWTPSGFVNDDTASALSGAPTLSSTDTPTSSAGTTFPITIAQGTLAAANYNFTFVNGTLSIVKKTTTLTLAVTPNPMLVNTSVAIVATVVGDPPSGTVTFCDGSTTPDAVCTGGTLLCTVTLTAGTSNSTATCTHAFATTGTHPLGAYYAGDGNFVATATVQALALSVNPPPIPAPALSTWLLGLLGSLLVMIGLSRTRT